MSILVLSNIQLATAAEVTRITLENGLRVVIVQNALAPVVTIQLNYLVGSNDAPDGFPGTAHALEHMMFRGSPGMTADQLAAINAAMGGECNAETQQTVTQYFCTVPTNAFETALKVESLRMKALLATDELWREERGAIEQEVARDLSSPMYLLFTQLLEKLFKGTPYEHDALGTRPSFEKTKAAMLRRFHRDWYVPNNAVLIIVGDIDPQRAIVAARRDFENIPARKLPERNEVRLRALSPSSIRMNSNLPDQIAVVAYRFPGSDSPDYAAGQLLADLLASQRAELYSLVTQGKSLSADFALAPLPKASAGYVVVTAPHDGNGEELLGLIKNIISGYVRDGVPEELVESARMHEIASTEFQKNSIEGLASAWSQAVAIEGRNAPGDDIEAIRKVTVADVNRVARQYLQNDSAITALLVPAVNGKAVTVQGGRSKEAFSKRNVKHIKLPRWARDLSGLPDVEAIKRENPADFILDNGLRVIVRTIRSSQSIGLYGMVRTRPEIQVPEGKEGVDSVMNELFSYGTTSLSRIDLLKGYDDIAADASAGTSFSLQALSSHFDRGVELLADNLLRPLFPIDAFNIVRQELSGELTGLLKSPAWVAGQSMKKLLYPKNDPVLRHATSSSVAALTLNDVTSYYRTVFRPDMTTIVIVGDIGADEARKTISRYFGMWKATGPKPLIDLPSVPDSRSGSILVPDPSRVQAEVELSETLRLKRKDQDFYPFQVGMHVLSGGFYATRLYRELREKTGLVYNVDSSLEASKTRSVLSIIFGSDAPKIHRARSLIKRELSLMQKQLVTDAELHQAKQLMLNQLALSGSSTQGIAGELLHLVRNGLPLDEPYSAARRYQKVTSQEIRKAFRRWVRPDSFSEVIRGPSQPTR
ncbi:insulinase family protein [Geobacter pelophilus]|uniref:Insulinase family protein n=1 Tax=Geoanaerobacter pelophilus TaxID=60036 RepID=A0AAW4LA70_9BACT|nr:insulinase family protein [Geoanaerobacter pelophilus]